MPLLLLGHHRARYFLHMSAPAFAVSRWATTLLSGIPDRGLRFWGSGGASVGSWFLALNVQHWEDSRLCADGCSTNMVATQVSSNCTSSCDLESLMLSSHNRTCGTAPIIPAGKVLLPEITPSFDASLEQCHEVRAVV